jgi:hypothetical protein
MKKVFIIFLVFFSVFSFSQEKKNTNKNVDKNVTQRMDSLSKQYKVKVVGAYEVTGGFKFLAQFFGFKIYRFISRIFAPNFERFGFKIRE